MKRILFVNRYPLDSAFPLKAKFDGQYAAAVRMGLKASRLVYDRENMYLETDGKRVPVRRIRTGLPGYEHFFYYIDAGRAAAKVLKKEKFDILYYRVVHGFLAVIAMGRAAKKAGTRLIGEIPSFYTGNKKEQALSLLRRLYGGWSEKLLKRFAAYVDLYALIGEENPSGRYLGKPSVDISNGIDLGGLPLRTPVNDAKLHLLALGSMGNWHGFDRLIRSAAECTDPRPYVIHMVGNNDGGCLEEWKRLAQEKHTEDRVVFHGPLYGKELSAMFDLCDAGVSSLGAFRLGVETLSSLKLREYAARGLPIVYAVTDPLLQEAGAAAERFALRVSNDDTAPDMKTILDFAGRCRADEHLCEELRAFAEKTMTWEAQLGKVLSALEKEQQL